ncbi:MAG TPA: hypothetical protein VL358_00910 [Caulobacteraceae bacterium]|jgi:hypothetical protein|nr:hypothetical protein [Caulobacteraceae bacterium]
MSDTPRKRLPLRWLTLAEVVGVLALALAALGYWDNHRARIQEDRERAAAARERQAEIGARPAFLMTGTLEADGEQVRLASVHPEQVIQTQTLWFPKSIRSDSIETTGNPRLEAGWIDEGLRKAAGKAKAGRAPVGVLTVFIEDGQTKTDRALYQIGYSLHPRVLRGDRVKLEGLSLARRNVAGDLQAAAGSLWPAQ